METKVPTKTIYQYKGQCYVRLRNDDFHESLKQKDSLIWYPENTLRFIELICYIPYIQSVMTESPFIISCYDRTNVWILNEEDKWVNPDFQTYGCGYSQIISDVLGYPHSIPLVIVSGREGISKFKEKYHIAR